jgi:hypothetical protein
MPSPSSTRAPRIAAGLLAGGLTVAALSACSFTSNNVSCTTSSCTATLSGDGATADILGTTIEFGGVTDGRATLGVGDASVSCAEGESVAVGPLSVTCSAVNEDSVEITASLN